MEQMPKGSVLKQLDGQLKRARLKTNNVRKIKQIQRIGDLDYEKTDL